MKINREILMTIVKSSSNKLKGDQEILEINEQQLHLISKKLSELFSLNSSSSQLKKKIKTGIEEAKKEIVKIVEDEDFRLSDNAQWSKQLGFARGKLNSLTNL